MILFANIAKKRIRDIAEGMILNKSSRPAIVKYLKDADKQIHAQYPDIKWKAGKLLNNASKQTLQDWVASNK